jgi:hypothetical protein
VRLPVRRRESDTRDRRGQRERAALKVDLEVLQQRFRWHMEERLRWRGIRERGGIVWRAQRDLGHAQRHVARVVVHDGLCARMARHGRQVRDRRRQAAGVDEAERDGAVGRQRPAAVDERRRGVDEGRGCGEARQQAQLVSRGPAVFRHVEGGPAELHKRRLQMRTMNAIPDFLAGMKHAKRTSAAVETIVTS